MTENLFCIGRQWYICDFLFFFLAIGRLPAIQSGVTYDDWTDQTRPIVDRMVRFEAWLRRQLVERLEWPASPTMRARQVGQCQTFVNGFLIDLNRRGWLFDGPKLAEIITSKLDDVAKRQKAGAVEDLWIYMRTVWTTYAGSCAEEFQRDSMRLGFHVSKVMRRMKSIPQAVAERQEQISADKLARARKLLRASQGDDRQGSLL